MSGAGMLGIYIRKDFDDFGIPEGVVVAYDKLPWYYKVAYKDENTDELTQCQVNEIAIVKDAPDGELLRLTRGNMVY